MVSVKGGGAKRVVLAQKQEPFVGHWVANLESIVESGLADFKPISNGQAVVQRIPRYCPDL